MQKSTLTSLIHALFLNPHEGAERPAESRMSFVQRSRMHMKQLMANPPPVKGRGKAGKRWKPPALPSDEKNPDEKEQQHVEKRPKARWSAW